MCHFIDLVLPQEADLDSARAVVKRHGRVLEPNPEPRVTRELTAGERAYRTSRTCDCGTGLAVQPTGLREHDDDREAARLQRLGWSESKVRRWREQRAQAAAQKAESRARSRQEEVGRWLGLVTELLDAGLEHVGLVVHWATDEVRRGPVVPRTRLNAEAFASLEENVLYTFARRP